MNKHGIEIEYLKSEGTINSLDFSSKPHNSSLNNLNTLTNVNVYENKFGLNLSDLRANKQYSSNERVGYYVSSDFSDANGNININLKIVSNGVSFITILFPREVYATSILVDGKQYNNTNDIFQFETSSKSSGAITNVSFKKLNIGNSPLVVLSVTSGVKVMYDDRYIKEIQRGSQASTDNELPNYEIVSQYGSVSFLDSDYLILSLKNSGKLRKPNYVKIWLNDEIIGNYKAISWKYDLLNNLVNIDLGDTIDNLREQEVEKYQEIQTTKTLYDVFIDIKSKLELSGQKFSTIDEFFIKRIKSVNMYIYRYNNCNLQELVNNFCAIAQCSMYINELGELEVYSWK